MFCTSTESVLVGSNEGRLDTVCIQAHDKKNIFVFFVLFTKNKFILGVRHIRETMMDVTVPKQL